MKFIRKNVAFRVIGWVLSLHILNCSVYNPDVKSDNIPADLIYNDMESIVEIIVEQIFNINDAIAEKEKCNEKGNFDFAMEELMEWQKPFRSLIIIYPFAAIVNNNSSVYHEQYSKQFQPEIVPPPPKA